MIEARDFLEPARAAGFTTWSGVPCSFLTPFINAVISDPGLQYVAAANEGDAVAVASGAALAGRRAVAIMQNSGLGNAVSPLSSLNWVFRLPVLLIVTLRGEPGVADEPQHELMGSITMRILEELQIPWAWFPVEADQVEEALQSACDRMDRSGLPFALVMRKGSVAPWQGQPATLDTPPLDCETHLDDALEIRMSRQEALQRVVNRTPQREAVVIASTGYTGRELFALNDRPNHLYMVGSMGCASALGLGFALSRPDLRTVVVEGDGALLMRLGNLPTIGACQPRALFHLLLDNGAHESTGGQATVSAGTDFVQLAAASGYRRSSGAVSAAGLDSFLDAAAGPAFHRQRIVLGTPPGLPRPDRSPLEVKRRLMSFFDVEAPWCSA